MNRKRMLKKPLLYLLFNDDDLDAVLFLFFENHNEKSKGQVVSQLRKARRIESDHNRRLEQFKLDYFAGRCVFTKIMARRSVVSQETNFNTLCIK